MRETLVRSFPQAVTLVIALVGGVIGGFLHDRSKVPVKPAASKPVVVAKAVEPVYTDLTDAVTRSMVKGDTFLPVPTAFGDNPGNVLIGTFYNPTRCPIYAVSVTLTVNGVGRQYRVYGPALDSYAIQPGEVGNLEVKVANAQEARDGTWSVKVKSVTVKGTKSECTPAGS